MSPKQSRRSAAELEARQADEALLVRRLEVLGLRGFRVVQVHENRSVLVSVAKRGVLRVHRGYAYASDRVLRAVLAFADPRSKSVERRRAEAEVVAFPVDEFVKPAHRRRRVERLHPGDRDLVRELQRRHQRLNRRYFDGRLAPIRFRLSNRMRTRLGELTVDPRKHRPTEIAISRQHIERDGWDEVEHTLLHEMVHQWQVESGLEVDHGETFRRKAVEVGVVPGARRAVNPKRRAAGRSRR